MLDLTCAPPAAGIEVGGRLLGRLDQEVFLNRVARTEQAVELLIDERLLLEEARFAHELLNHYESGADLLADVDDRRFSSVPAELRAELVGVADPVVERVLCLARRLRVLPG